MATVASICRQSRRWLKERGISTAPLTGQDARALDAFVHTVEAYAVADPPGRAHALRAMTEIVLVMQPSTRHIAKATIPMVLDWGDEETIWSLLDVSMPSAVTTCPPRSAL